MHRFFLPAHVLQDEIFEFPSEQAHQIFRVLRLKNGQHIMALDGSGNEYEVELLDVNADTVSGEILSKKQACGEPAFFIHLYLGLTQREKFEWILQKCTEVGVSFFTPVISSRSLVQKEKNNPKKMERWQRILQEAAEQSGRGRVPGLSEPLPFEAALAQIKQNAVPALVLWESENQNGLKHFIRSAVSGKETTNMAILVGPEGGYSEAEIQECLQAGIMPVSIGKRILRMETAAVVGSALLLYELGEMA